MDISRLHKYTYDLAADEYEARVESLRPVTLKVVKAFQPYISSGDKILDIGCGVGLALQILSEHKIDVCGIDISSRMVFYTRRRNPGALIIEGDFIKYDFHNQYEGLLAFGRYPLN